MKIRVDRLVFLQSSTGNYLEMTSVIPSSIQSAESSKEISDSVKLLEQSDEMLMQNYSKGKVEAFEELYRRHQAPLYRYCIRQFRNVSIAEECFQEIWMKLVRSRNRYLSTAKFTTYLYRIAQNHIIDTYRKEKKRLFDCEYDESSSAHELSLQKDARTSEQSEEATIRIKTLNLRKAIGELPFEQRNTLLLKMDNGLSIEQIAEITSCNKESVKSRLRYATTKLKQLLNSNIILPTD